MWRGAGKEKKKKGTIRGQKVREKRVKWMRNKAGRKGEDKR